MNKDIFDKERVSPTRRQRIPTLLSSSAIAIENKKHLTTAKTMVL